MKRVVILAMSVLLLCGNGYGQFWKKKKKASSAKTEVKKLSDYDKLMKDSEVQKGVLNILKNKDKFYIEINKELFKREFLLGSRVSEVSNNKDVLAGQQLRQPKRVRFDYDGKKILLKLVNNRFLTDDEEHIGVSLKRNYTDPIMHAFDVKAYSKDSSSFIIDVTKFFCSNVKELNPFKQAGGMFGRKSTSGSFESSKSMILSAKAFPKNINFRTRMAYAIKGKPFTAVMTRSFLLLPEKAMRPRYWDKRIGYFAEVKYLYTSKKDELQKLKYVNRWDIKPRPEDVEKHKRGELVEPEKPIVWYVDTAIPEKWRKYVRQGIEDWQQAFEAIGFKNAIVARDYPTKEENPDFDPDDIRYSCYRYVTTHVPNSMGPSWVDPRSGEIIQGDVLFYHNIIKILHSWQFVQTGACDPEVRKRVFDDDKMGESLRYVAAHEVGHTLGLMHNMAASYSIPVDSLRSPKFTHKYGTTTSIMDYARYNYVAQPEDKGVKLTPPNMGVYDIYAIKWAYKPIYTAATPAEEYKTLNEWILEKKDDPMYFYGEQQFLIENDPASQAEALGDDAIKASLYGIKNLKLINKNLIKWTAEENMDYKFSESMYNALFDQMFRYVKHVTMYLGGVYLDNPVNGDGKKSFKFVPRKKQKEALDFLFTQINDLPNWILNRELEEHSTFMDSEVLAEYMGEISVRIINPGILSRLKQFELYYPKQAYTQVEFMDDVFKKVFAKTIKGQSLNYYDKVIQYEYVRLLMKTGKYPLRSKAATAFKSFEDCLVEAEPEMEESRAAVIETKQNGSGIVLNAVFHHQLKEVYKLLRRKMNTGNKTTRIHYSNMYYNLEKIFK